MRIGYLAERFGVCEPAGISLPMFNIAPGEYVPVITGTGGPGFIMMHWGLIPSWATGEKPELTPVNARAEGLYEKKLFRSLLSEGRCIVPATGFYEWKQSGNQKYPVYFRVKSQEVFGMAGLWDSWKAPDGRIIRSFSIVTTTPNSVVLPFHNRMPVILEHADEKIWLDPDYCVNGEPLAVLHPYPPDDMEVYRVTRKVNNPLFKSEASVKEEIPPEETQSGWWDTR